MLSRETIGTWIESNKVTGFIIGVILLNAITLGMETIPYFTENFSHILEVVDRIILGIFIIEILLKFYAFHFRFFQTGWNIFDFLIVGIALLPNAGTLSILRVLRVFRVFRLVSTMPSLRKIVSALILSLPGIASIALLAGIIFYIGAVMTTKLFGGDFPDWFGSIPASMYTLFQVMTLESWSMGIVRPVMEKFPHAYIFFIPYIVISTFTTLNLFIAVIVNSIATLDQEQKEEDGIRVVSLEMLYEEIKTIQSSLIQLEKAQKK
ncbi:ion transporter [Leptospira sp. GIMC2001]|uniref:ion transporter n=1 Tax=Leptospira sp. GIMC2001 TaxID=1513297 RepID=UPI002349965D|nr:ion transporter [Leptospira sp. GIMC2001]WCL49812.1 ion transporter [Leptospira sp. GIMC2001]